MPRLLREVQQLSFFPYFFLYPFPFFPLALLSRSNRRRAKHYKGMCASCGEKPRFLPELPEAVGVGLKHASEQNCRLCRPCVEKNALLMWGEKDADCGRCIGEEACEPCWCCFC